ncbi:MAG TPA: hypothetical protein VIG64_10225 [Actinomycetota bacterium]|jgi:hypothetical protein
MAFTDENTCFLFDDVPDPGGPELQRFIVGEDDAPRTLAGEEAASELGDAFARLVLLKGDFPSNAMEVLAAIDAAVPEDDSLRAQRVFLLGEDSKLGVTFDTESTNSSMRFLVTRGRGPDGPDILISAFHPMGDLVELMAWDLERKGFNYYRTFRGAGSSWMWAGNSRHALQPPTRLMGPFESHPSGAMIMKELRFPWVHWHSFAANIFPDAFPPGDDRREHEWFTTKQGAEVCEESVAKPSIRRWVNARFEAAAGDGGRFENPAGPMEQLLKSVTVNLISSKTESRAVRDDRGVDLPQTFFIDSETLTEVIGLVPPPGFAVSPAFYKAALQRFGFRLHADGFEQAGDNHFAFVVPERAFEDRVVVAKMIEVGLITDRLAAALLMVDFPNPVFSSRREKLLSHMPTDAVITGGSSSFSDDVANAIVAAAETSSQGSAEREFADLWAAGDGWRDRFDALLRAYYAAVTEKLEEQAAYDDYVRLAESRRRVVRKMPIGREFSLLFSEAAEDPGPLRMTTDGAVVADEGV